jgi:hypothetical protein
MLTARQTKEIARQISDPTDAQDNSIIIENLIKEALTTIELQAKQGLYTTTIITWNNLKNKFQSSGEYYHVVKVLLRLGYKIEWDVDNSTDYVRISWD